MKAKTSELSLEIALPSEDGQSVRFTTASKEVWEEY